MWVKQVNNFDVDNFGFTESLKYLNIRENKVDKIEEIVKLNAYTNLKTLVCNNNPFISKCEGFNIYSLLKNFRFLKRINKTEVDLPVLRELYEYEKGLYLEEKRIEEEKRKAEEEAEREAEEAVEEE